jgi:protein-S-isoprenylcysteine O-methyltransferase Ste14
METAWYFRLFFVHLATFIVSWTLYGVLKAKRMGAPTGRAWMLFFWIAFIVGWVLMWFIPFRINAAFWIGLAIIGLGEVLYALGFLAMREHPERKKAVVDWGIYRASKHSHIMAGDICLFGTLIVGWAASTIYGILWIYFTLYLIVSHFYVLSEEKANIKKFGKEYEDYMKRTPRYIGMPK